MKLKTIIEITPALSALGATKLPAKIAYRVAKALNAIKADYTTYEEQRTKLLRELGTPDKVDPNIVRLGDNAAAFDEQIKALIDEDVAVTLPTITLDDLGDASIEPMHLAALDGIFIVEPKPTTPEAPHGAH